MEGMTSAVGETSGAEEPRADQSAGPRAHEAKWRRWVRKAVHGHTLHGPESWAEAKIQGPGVAHCLHDLCERAWARSRAGGSEFSLE